MANGISKKFHFFSLANGLNVRQTVEEAEFHLPSFDGYCAFPTPEDYQKWYSLLTYTSDRLLSLQTWQVQVFSRVPNALYKISKKNYFKLSEFLLTRDFLSLSITLVSLYEHSTHNTFSNLFVSLGFYVWKRKKGFTKKKIVCAWLWGTLQQSKIKKCSFENMIIIWIHSKVEKIIFIHNFFRLSQTESNNIELARFDPIFARLF